MIIEQPLVKGFADWDLNDSRLGKKKSGAGMKFINEMNKVSSPDCVLSVLKQVEEHASEEE